MDTIRRWQIATAVTAATGLGLGAMALGQQPTHDVATIELTPSPPSSVPRVVDDVPTSDDTEIVTPEVQSLEASAPSLDSPEAPSPPASEDTAPDASTSTEPAPLAPVEDPDSPDSPASVDSGDSLDSD